MKAVEKEENGHAKFSASGSDRWLNCSGSIALAENAPPQKDSIWSKEGTDAHACLEMFLKNPKGKTASVQKMLVKTYPEPMVTHALEAAQEIWRRVPESAVLLAETKVSLEFVAPDMFGTVDAAVVDEFGRLQVIDFKYGAGVPVDVEDNPQLIYYGLGLAHLYDYNFSDIELVVIQPRADHHSGETVRSVVMSIDELRGWENTFRDGVERAEDPLADLNPGKWCQFCSAKSICPAVGDLAFKQAQVDFAPVEMLRGSPVLALPALPGPEALPNLGHVLQAGDKIEKWLEGVRAHAMHVLETGGVVEGYKLVEKRAQRSWIDEAATGQEALDTFGQDAYKLPELLSPAQFEKKFKGNKEWVAERTTRVSSGLTMVPVSDKRDAVGQIEQDFTPVPTLVQEIDVEAVTVEDNSRLPDIFARVRTKPTKRKAKPEPKRHTKAPRSNLKPKAKPRVKAKAKIKAKAARKR